MLKNAYPADSDVSLQSEVVIDKVVENSSTKLYDIHNE